MIIRGVIRFDVKQVQAAQKGTLTQFRAPANLYDPDHPDSRRTTAAGKARPGDLFWLGEPAVYWTAWNAQSDYVFPADHETGRSPAPQWIAGRRGLKRHTLTPDKLARAYSKRCLEVTAQALERLNSITTADAEACGTEMFMGADKRPHHRMLQDHRIRENDPVAAFLDYWGRLYGADSLARNPIVAVVSFRLIEQNADEYLEKRNAELGAARVADAAVGERAA